MKEAPVLVLAGVLAMTTVVVQAVQPPARPDFSGHWVLTQPAGARGRAPLCGRQCVIVQTADRLHARMTDVDTTAPNYNADAGLYFLNGAPIVHTIHVSGYTAVLTKTARWEGATLVLNNTTQSTNASATPALTSELRVSLHDGLLIIEGTRPPAAIPPPDAGPDPRFRYEFKRRQDLVATARRDAGDAAGGWQVVGRPWVLAGGFRVACRAS